MIKADNTNFTLEELISKKAGPLLLISKNPHFCAYF